MGRELRRVPLNFDWPIDKVWWGYINPYFKQSTECGSCSGSTLAPAARLISELFYNQDPNFLWPSLMQLEAQSNLTPKAHELAAVIRTHPKAWLRWADKITQDEVEELVRRGRLVDWTHTCNAVPGEGWKPKNPPYMPTADEVNDANSLVRPSFLRCHDGINRWILIEFRAKKYGVWDFCYHCDDGRAWPAGVKEKYESWASFEPPTGDGYQLWETTTEGSPQSPVFSTLDELCAWCAECATTFANHRATVQEWREMLQEGEVVCHRTSCGIFL